jgi:hypothetical protein
MRRQILLTLVSTTLLAHLASAACDDTLYLQSISVYTQTLKNSATLGATWDTALVNPWDSADVIKAGPLTFAPYEAFYTDPFFSMTHTRKFSSNCSPDSVSPLQNVNVSTDTLWVDDYHRKSVYSSEVVSESAPVRRKWTTNGYFFWLSNGDTLKANETWTSDRFDLATLSTPWQPTGWYMQVMGMGIHVPQRYSSLEPFFTSCSLVVNSHGSLTFRSQAIAQASNKLAGMSALVSKIGNGRFDSTRAQVRLFQYRYGKSNPVGVKNRPGAAAPFRIGAIGNSFVATLPKEAVVSVVSVDGRTVRQFPSSRSFAWDGRDAAGRMVQPGVWLIRAQGLGSVPVLVR